MTVHREIYQQACNKVTTLITKAKTSYCLNKVEECGTDQRAMFKVVDLADVITGTPTPWFIE
jgi:hypothetical protein